MTGPPFVFDPTATYPDQNVQAWAQYYAQGGEDPTGSVYFISVPGITDGRPALSPLQTQLQGQQQPGEGQQPQQGGAGVAAVAATGVATSLNNDSDNSNRNSQEGSDLAHQNSLSNPYTSSTSSLPNPYGSAAGGLEYDETSGPVSAGHVQSTAGSHAPWQIQGQFAQMRVGEPSVGA
jgi:signal transducing adaptor molecule